MPPDLLSALRAIDAGADGAALLAALGRAMNARTRVGTADPEPWTVGAVIAQLSDHPEHVTLLGALRLLQGAQPDKARIGYARNAGEEPVRIDQALHLDFAPREVIGIEPDGAGGDAGAGSSTARPQLTQAAVGLLGPNGVLPFRWTEHAHDLAHNEYRSQRDNSFHALLNVMQRRQVAFLYRAWSDTQVTTGADRPDEAHPIADRLRALSGLLLQGLRDRDSVPEAFKMAFAAALSRTVRSPQPLAGLLAHFFGAPVVIEEFVARWLDIPKDQRTRIGHSFNVLGVDAVAGSRVWDATTRFRILIGPIDQAQYTRFLPHGEAYAQLRDLVSLYAGVEFDWELMPVLQRAEVPLSWLGNSVQLGWTSWLGVRVADADAQDLRLAMHPRLGAAATAA